MFKREDYYSQTEISNKYKLSSKKIKAIILENNIDIIEKEITTYYTIVAKYVLKTEFDNAMEKLLDETQNTSAIFTE